MATKKQSAGDAGSEGQPRPCGLAEEEIIVQTGSGPGVSFLRLHLSTAFPTLFVDFEDYSISSFTSYVYLYGVLT